jgi:hypothetical protein
MNKKIRKLVLGKETLKNLETSDLGPIHGAADPNATVIPCSAIDACPTRLCPPSVKGRC